MAPNGNYNHFPDPAKPEVSLPAEGPLETAKMVAGITALAVASSVYIVAHSVAEAYRKLEIPEKVGAGVDRAVGAIMHLGDK